MVRLFEPGLSVFLRQAFFLFAERVGKNPRKVYCIDTGIRNAVSFRFNEDLGRIMENIVFLKFLHGGADIFYRKDAQGYEVDFVTMGKREIGDICQVSFDLSEAKTKHRELRALLRSLAFFNLKEGLNVTEDMEAQETIDGCLIRYVPLWKFLL